LSGFIWQRLYIFLMRQFFTTIPCELEDAALIDGCNHWKIFWQIILPLAKPIMATVTVFAFMGSWNDYIGPLIYLSEKSQYTLSLGLQVFVQNHRTEWGMLMAASAMMVAPVIVLFFFAQKQFVQAITLSGLKDNSPRMGLRRLLQGDAFEHPERIPVFVYFCQPHGRNIARA
jgi:multiple sugar transport system permease protein